MASKIGGRIAKINVREGQEVKKGDKIIEFEIPEYEARRRQLQEKILRSEAELKELQHGPRPAEIEEGRAAGAEAKARYDLMKHGYRAEEIEKARSDREESEATLDLLLHGYRKEDVRREQELMEEARVRAEWNLKEAKRYEVLAAEGAVVFVNRKRGHSANRKWGHPCCRTVYAHANLSAVIRRKWIVRQWTEIFLLQFECFAYSQTAIFDALSVSREAQAPLQCLLVQIAMLARSDRPDLSILERRRMNLLHTRSPFNSPF